LVPIDTKRFVRCAMTACRSNLRAIRRKIESRPGHTVSDGHMLSGGQPFRPPSMSALPPKADIGSARRGDRRSLWRFAACLCVCRIVIFRRFTNGFA